MISYIDFQEKMRVFPGFDKRRLVEWQEKGYIKKLRNKYYTFSNRGDDHNFLSFTANQLYRPSYISSETALARYGLIPDLC